jgi:hypothetical protein
LLSLSNSPSPRSSPVRCGGSGESCPNCCSATYRRQECTKYLRIRILLHTLYFVLGTSPARCGGYFVLYPNYFNP